MKTLLFILVECQSCECTQWRGDILFNLKLIEFIIYVSAAEMCRAARDGDVERIKRLVKAGHDVNQRDGWERTPLMCAASKGHTDCVEYLIQIGAQLELEDKDGHTALKLASQQGHDSTVKLLRTAADKGE